MICFGCLNLYIAFQRQPISFLSQLSRKRLCDHKKTKTSYPKSSVGAPEKMAPTAISEPDSMGTTISVAKSQPVKKVEKEVTPLEAISHGDVLPGQ